MATSAQQVTSTGQTVMVSSPSDPKKGRRVTGTIFVNNPDETATVKIAVITFNPANSAVRVIHEGDLSPRESVVIDSPVEIVYPEQLRLRVDSLGGGTAVNFYVQYTSAERAS
jgi:hypothetical protein